MPKGIKGFQKGQTSPMKGKRHTEYSKEQNRQKHLGKIPWNKNINMWKGKEHPRGMKGKTAWNKGIKGVFHHSDLAKEKIRKRLTNIKRSDTTKQKLRFQKLGDKNPAKRPDVRKKMSDAQKGEKSYRWQGGIAQLPYSVDWTKDLKRAIRKRDRYTCQICKKEPAICVHHIDYNKMNCKPDNLITLCFTCHPKTNMNRQYWIDYFNNKLNI